MRRWGGCAEHLYRCSEHRAGCLRCSLHSLTAEGRSTPVGRLLTWLRHEARTPLFGPATSRRLAGSDEREVGERALHSDLLPMHLPVRPASLFKGQAGGLSRRRMQRLESRRLAWLFAECQVAALCYFQCGCPKRSVDFRRHFGRHSTSAGQAAVFENLRRHNLLFCRPCPGLPERGRGIARLTDLLSDFELRWEHGRAPRDARQTACTALPVIPDRVQLPQPAGVLDPADVLPEPRRSQFLDLPARTLPDHDQVDLPNFCYHVSEDAELVLRKRFLDCGLAGLIAEEDIPLTNEGRPLLGGMFAVPHKKEKDRLIYDRRPQNFGESRLNWAQLPYGPQLTRLALKPSEGIRGSGDDLRTFFYQLKNTPAAAPRSAFGRKFDGAGWEDFGGKAGRSFRLYMRTIAMGDLNAVDVAQTTHVCVLEQGGCMQPQETLIYGAPLPLSSTMEGLYIDDHFALSIVPLHKMTEREGRDLDIIDASHAVYEKHRLPRSHEKSFGFSRGPDATAEASFTILGTEVQSASGVVSAPLLKRQQLLCLAANVLALPEVSRDILDRFVGLFTHVYMHRRELMSIFSRVYSWCRSLADDSPACLPADIRSELLAASWLLPLAETCIRWPVSSRVSATDATPSAGGAVYSHVGPDLVEALWRSTEQRGAYVRLDTRAVRGPASLDTVEPLVGELFECMDWSVSRSRRFRTTKHVNLQELEEICEEVRAAARLSLQPSRHINGSDSLVAVGAWSKGRSSSYQINRRLRSVLSWKVLGQKSVENLHLATDRNPADEPSRFKPLKPRKTPADWMSPLLVPAPLCASVVPHRRTACRVFQECFAGAGGLSRAMSRAGVQTRRPIEAFPCTKGQPHYVRECDVSLREVQFGLLDDIRGREVGKLHLGLPCRTWGPAGRLAGGSRRLGSPWGDGSLAREIDANREAAFVVAVCCELLLAGAHYSIENPRDSYVFTTDLFLELAALSDSVEVIFDQCCYGLRADPSVRCLFLRKPTKVLTSFRGLEKLAATCPGQCSRHQHQRVWGSVRIGGVRKSVTQLAGKYPDDLCKAWAQVLAEGKTWGPPLLHSTARARALLERAVALMAQ